MSQKTFSKQQIKKYLRICNTDACHKHIGIKATKITLKEARLELKLSPRHLNFENCVHGGILSFLMDTVMGFAVYPHLHEGERILVVDLKVTYLKAALLTMKKITGRSRLVARTKRFAVSEGEIISPSGDILCKGMGTYAVITR
ncbi:MAG: thioesterase family protein [uncultured bacterium]|nr:MAG: thioesterase family protein [uncultured bacterium]HLD46064.1 PaaI family thioesterase [bacterium]